jgi:hypothetical protein
MLILNACRKNTGAKAQLKIIEINPRSRSKELGVMLLF